jgi:sulfur carrier protein ThiS
MDDESNFSKLAAKIDHASAIQIQQWQNDDMLKWLWESYQISSKQYAVVHNGSVLDQTYADTNIPIAEKRVEMAGIRLAGLLNKIYK